MRTILTSLVALLGLIVACNPIPSDYPRPSRADEARATCVIGGQEVDLSGSVLYSEASVLEDLTEIDLMLDPLDLSIQDWEVGTYDSSDGATHVGWNEDGWYGSWADCGGWATITLDGIDFEQKLVGQVVSVWGTFEADVCEELIFDGDGSMLEIREGLFSARGIEL